MAFPSGPTNNQVATVGGITYIYNSTKGAWVRTVSSGTNLTANSLTISSGATSTTTTTGAVIVTGGVGIGGSMNVGGTVTATTLVGNFTGTISSGQVTTALGFTPYNATNPSGYISAVPNASTQVSSLGVGTAASGTTGEIRATNNITAYFSSDSRLKENVRDIPNALDKVSAIGGKLFDWTDEYVADHGGLDDYFMRKADFGVIAQDVEQVLPEAVRTREDGYLAVDYEKMCALAFAAIKELQQQVQLLEQQIKGK
jgi:hypothetical protein